MILSMEPLHISEGDLAKDVRSVLQSAAGCSDPTRGTSAPENLRVHRPDAGRLHGDYRSRLREGC
jgi:hypothetical protein